MRKQLKLSTLLCHFCVPIISLLLVIPFVFIGSYLLEHLFWDNQPNAWKIVYRVVPATWRHKGGGVFS